MESDQMESRVSLRELLPSCITSCVSVRRKDSQGCTADVKDTPPSPEETSDDLIGPDIDLLGDHDDLSAEEMAHQRNKESESAMRQVSSSFDVSIRRHFVNRVSLRELLSFCITSFSVRRKDSQGCTADVKDTPPSPEETRLDLSSFEKKHIGSDDGFFESPDDLMTTGSMESIDSGVSFKSDQSKAGRIDFKDRVSPREEMNQELSSEVGWNMVEANAGSCF